MNGENSPPPAKRWDLDWLPLYFVTLLLMVLLLVAAAVGQQNRDGGSGPGRDGGRPPSPGAITPLAPDLAGSSLPGGASEIFADDRILVAFYGTAGTAALGVLGEGSPDETVARLQEAARAFGATGRPVLPVLELIVTVAHAGPTRSGTYSSDIDRESVQRYIDAAHKHGVLLLLDLQPGRADFLEVARRWEWALKDPHVGLALDPEWRMGPGQVPGQQIGSVAASEVNQVAAWLEELTVSHGLPEKLFVLHQFRGDMIRQVSAVRDFPHLATVQHIDGFGPPRAKLEAFAALARPAQFELGLKLFYDEDVPRLQPAQVLRIRPEVSFVSYQ